MSLTMKSQGLNLDILDPDNIKLYIDDEEELTLELKDQNKKYHRVEVNPAFPLSQVGRYLSFIDEEEYEIGMLRDINDLDPCSQAVIEETLEKIYFMPKIIKIYSIEEEYGLNKWEVETEKGFRSFDIKSRRRDVRPHANGRIIIHDIDGNRYEITDYRKLDKNSRKVIKSEI